MAYTETDLEITVDWLKDMLREKSSVADTEIRDLIESCVLELKIAGVQGNHRSSVPTGSETLRKSTLWI